jgi:hypothetical protein
MLVVLHHQHPVLTIEHIPASVTVHPELYVRCSIHVIARVGVHLIDLYALLTPVVYHLQYVYH